MNKKINKQQKKLIKTANFDKGFNRWHLDIEQIMKLENLVTDYVENHFYWNSYDEVTTLIELITIGYLEKIMSYLNEL